MNEHKNPIRIAVLGTSMLLMGIEGMLRKNEKVQVEQIALDSDGYYRWEDAHIDVLIFEQPVTTIPGLQRFLKDSPNVKTIQLKVLESKVVVSMQKEKDLSSLEDLIDVIQHEN
jgi:hypothetical protein